MKLMTTAVVAGALALAGAVGGVTAGADPDSGPSVQPIGAQGTIVDGPITQGWTITELKPSPDAVLYEPQGVLWEATATAEAIQGIVVPVVMGFGARSPSGQLYPALFTVGTPQGLSPFPIEQGQKTTGKVYFDVTGDAPDAVVYQSGDQDLLTWVPKAPPPRGHSGGGSGSRPVAPPRPAPAAPPRPAPAGGENAPLPVNSQGTPLPAGAPEVHPPGN